MKKTVKASYYDRRLNSRESMAFHVPIGYVDSQVLYLFKRQVGYGYAKRYIRDLSVSYEVERGEQQLSMFKGVV